MPATRRHRSRAITLAAATLALVTVAACGKPWNPLPPDPPTTTTGPTTTIPATTASTVTTTTAPHPTTTWYIRGCGTLRLASGWPTTTAAHFPTNPMVTCLFNAFESGEQARLVVREQTDGNGGAIVETTYETFGWQQVRVTVDATQAADRPQVITVELCTGLARDFDGITTSGCRPA